MCQMKRLEATKEWKYLSKARSFVLLTADLLSTKVSVVPLKFDDDLIWFDWNDDDLIGLMMIWLSGKCAVLQSRCDAASDYLTIFPIIACCDLPFELMCMCVCDSDSEVVQQQLICCCWGWQWWWRWCRDCWCCVCRIGESIRWVHGLLWRTSAVV